MVGDTKNEPKAVHVADGRYALFALMNCLRRKMEPREGGGGCLEYGEIKYGGPPESKKSVEEEQASIYLHVSADQHKSTFALSSYMTCYDQLLRLSSSR